MLHVLQDSVWRWTGADGAVRGYRALHALWASTASGFRPGVIAGQPVHPVLHDVIVSGQMGAVYEALIWERLQPFA